MLGLRGWQAVDALRRIDVRNATVVLAAGMLMPMVYRLSCPRSLFEGRKLVDEAAHCIARLLALLCQAAWVLSGFRAAVCNHGRTAAQGDAD
jgi:hypothetical protein